MEINNIFIFKAPNGRWKAVVGNPRPFDAAETAETLEQSRLPHVTALECATPAAALDNLCRYVQRHRGVHSMDGV
jgi:hypothetical protein